MLASRLLLLGRLDKASEKTVSLTEIFPARRGDAQIYLIDKGIADMKKVFSKRTLIIMFFPVVFVLIILTLGLPQRLLTAVRVGEEKYNIAAYNYYYYEAYYGFANENYDHLDEIGLNINQDLRRQNYDADTTWAEHFRTVTLEDMREYTILRCEAAQAGFDASEEIGDKRAESEALLREACIQNNISDVDKYLSQLYDAGMTEDIYYTQLANRTLAEAYRTELMVQLAPSDSEVEAYKEEHYTDGEYATADVVIAYFSPAQDRVTGEKEERQWNNAETLALAAQARAGELGGDLAAFETVAAQFSQLEDEDVADGHYTGLTRDDLEETLRDWCYDSARKAGDNTVLRGETGWYLIYFNGYGESNLTLRAREDLLQERYEAWLAERKLSYPLETSAIPMIIAR